MQVIIFFLILFNITCYSYIVKPIEEYKYEKVKLPDGNFKISYRNGETFIGSINKEEIPIKGMIYKTGTQTLIGGITEERELFTIEDNIPEWCRSGDCINGLGVAKFKTNRYFPDYTKNSDTYYERSELEFRGEYKNFTEHTGKIYSKINGEEMLVYLLKDGKLSETNEFKKYKIVRDKEIKEGNEQRRKENEHQERKSSDFHEVLVSCGALDRYCIPGIKIEYISHQQINTRPCYKNDYNRGYVRSGDLTTHVVYYNCSMRGAGQSIQTKSIIYINTSDDGSRRCSTRYENLCN